MSRKAFPRVNLAMDADFSIELGPPREEAVLEMPWDSGVPDGPRYLDLKRHPEMLSSGGRGDRVSGTGRIPDAGEFPRLDPGDGQVRRVARGRSLPKFEKGNDGCFKMAAYVDLVFAAEDAEARVSFFGTKN